MSFLIVFKVLEAGNRAPSWGNTQPWKIYVASGQVLEGIRTEFQRNVTQKVAWTTDLPFPQDWPEAQKRNYDLLGKERYAVLSKVFEKDALPEIIMATNYRFFDASLWSYRLMKR